jgi:hypothetical protein
MLKWFSLKKLLLIMGISIGAFVVSVLLHNVISGLLDVEEPVFFLIAIVLCPTAFLVGAVGSIILAVKKFGILKRSSNISR